MNKLAKKILFFAGSLAVGAVVVMGLRGNDSALQVTEVSKTSLQDRLLNERAIDSAVAMLREGNVVLRMGMGAYSNLIAQMNLRDKSYSHCGIVMMENGYPFVYHSIGGEDNPDERMRRDSAAVFFSQAGNTGIGVVQYALTAEQEAALRKVVTAYYSRKPKFDMQFDLGTDDTLYCTELVYKAINAATGDTAYIPTTQLGARRFVSTDNLYVNGHGSLVWKVKFK